MIIVNNLIFGRRKFECASIISITEVVPIVFTNPFDFMVVRFNYTKPLDGTDLDIMVYYDNTGTIYDKDAVGYGQGTIDDVKIPTNDTPDTDSYLWWASDDVSLPAGECVEAVVIGIDNFNTNETTIGTTIDTYLRVGWYQTIGIGTLDLELITYLGGTMSKVGTNIINTGGITASISTKTVNVTAGTGQVTEINSNLVGTVIYDKSLKTATLV